ncbi:MAG: hypothetical protein JST67_04405 [Bacteroidetes bacterium]|nr:hypothetical protein [Bacteroidota bacterium]
MIATTFPHQIEYVTSDVHEKIELIVVFKKEVELKEAEAFLTKTKVKFREGMDSSRGRIYFYKTGPKFILTFETAQERKKFEKKYKSAEEVYEIYEPDWDIRKD